MATIHTVTMDRREPRTMDYISKYANYSYNKDLSIVRHNDSKKQRNCYGTPINFGPKAEKLGTVLTAINGHPDAELDCYEDIQKPGALGNRKLFLQVVVMAIASLLYIAVGVTAGFFMGKYCKYNFF